MVEFKTYYNLIVNGIGLNINEVVNSLQNDGVSPVDISYLITGLYENFSDNATADAQFLAVKIDKQLHKNEKIENGELARLSGIIGALAYDTFSHGY